MRVFKTSGSVGCSLIAKTGLEGVGLTPGGSSVNTSVNVPRSFMDVNSFNMESTQRGASGDKRACLTVTGTWRGDLDVDRSPKRAVGDPSKTTKTASRSIPGSKPVDGSCTTR